MLYFHGEELLDTAQSWVERHTMSTVGTTDLVRYVLNVATLFTLLVFLGLLASWILKFWQDAYNGILMSCIPATATWPTQCPTNVPCLVMSHIATFTGAFFLHLVMWWKDYTGRPRRNVPDFGRVFLMLKYTDITQNTYVQSWTVTEIMASCYTLTDYQIHIKTGRNMWFL